MALLIDFEEIEKAGLVLWPEIIGLVERALSDLSRYGEQVNHPRRRLHCPDLTRISIHAGASGAYELLGMMIHSELPIVTEEGEKLDRQIVRGRGDYIYVLYESKTAALAGIIRRGRDQRGIDYRTAATSVAGTKRLMRDGSKVLALFGSSHQARSHLEAMSRVARLDKVKVFSPNPEHRKKFSLEMSRKLPLEVEPAESPRAALQGADAVIEASNTAVPVFSGEWLEEGMHVTSIAGSNRELASQQGVVRKAMDAITLARSRMIFVNLKEQVRQDRQGEIFECLEKGVLDWEKIMEIGDLVAGKSGGRESQSEITFYNNNAGLGVVDVALGAYVYGKAKEHGMGIEI